MRNSDLKIDIAAACKSLALGAGILTLGCVASAPQLTTQAPEGHKYSPATAEADSVLIQIADEFFDALMEERYPVEATILDVTGTGHDSFPDNSEDALNSWFDREDDWLSRLQRIDPAEIDAAPLYATVTEFLEASISTRVCREHLWQVNQLTGWQTLLPMVVATQPIETAKDQRRALRRFATLPAFVEIEIDNLLRGISMGYTAPRINVGRVIDQLDGLIGGKTTPSPLMQPAEVSTDSDFSDRWQELIETEVGPSLTMFRDFLETEYLPQARAEPAVSELPHGIECYRGLVRSFTTADHQPEQLVRLGRQELQATRGAMTEIIETEFGTRDLEAALARLRTDESFTFTTREEIIDVAEGALTRASEAAPEWFVKLPSAAVVIRAYDESEERSAPDSYLPPSSSGSRPGIYRINTANPQQRSRAPAEATTFHETIPGHHVQIGLAQEQPAVHPIRRLPAAASFVEGWALYAERLADEMGLYSNAVSRIGMHSHQALRAVRMIVDPGLHVFGWSRDQAIDFMVKNTLLNAEESALEVDRYIIQPGQATAYMIGRLQIEALREEAEHALGPRFDLPQFHHAVLGNGAVTMGMLRDQVEAWIESVLMKSIN